MMHSQFRVSVGKVPGKCAKIGEKYCIHDDSIKLSRSESFELYTKQMSMRCKDVDILATDTLSRRSGMVGPINLL